VVVNSTPNLSTITPSHQLLRPDEPVHTCRVVALLSRYALRHHGKGGAPPCKSQRAKRRMWFAGRLWCAKRYPRGNQRLKAFALWAIRGTVVHIVRPLVRRTHCFVRFDGGPPLDSPRFRRRVAGSLRADTGSAGIESGLAAEVRARSQGDPGLLQSPTRSTTVSWVSGA
jgi:hypothetical protein